MTNKQLLYVILAGLFLMPFVPLIVSSSLFFPFIVGKGLAFRTIVEIISVCYLVLAFRDESYRPKFSWVLGSILLFLVAIGLADIFSANPFKSFWSNFERMEGYITLLHLGAYFLVMSSVLKTQQVWNKLLATSVGASAIMAVYSFFQLAGKITISQGGVRVDGTLGNASYLGIYMVFNIFFAALLMTRSQKMWQKILLGVVTVLDLIVLYFTATRGAILGLIGGAFIAFLFLTFKSQKGDKIRKIAASGIIFLAVFVGLFIAFKNNSFIKNNPVLGRFATLSFSEIKTQGRYYVWPMAWKGFLERPVLGWGQESFNFVFNKYYDPQMYTQEPWFDRTHDIILDWLIAGGLVGLLSYLSIFAALVYHLFKAKEDFLSKEDKAIVLGLLSAYMFHNLFVFDQIVSYILFFMILAYIHSHSPETNVSLWQKVSVKMRDMLDSNKTRPILESIVLIAFAFVFYFSVYSPWQQNKNLMEVLKLGNQGSVGAIATYAKPLESYNMGFPESLEHISQAAISLLSNQQASNEFKQQLFDTVDKAFKKQVEKVPDDARYRLFYGVFLSRFGQYDSSLAQLDEALKLSPKKQQIYYEAVSDLLVENKVSEALEKARYTYELAPANDEAKIVYGITATIAGDFATASNIFSQVDQTKLIFDDRYLNILLSLKQYQKIIEVAQKRVELQPNNLQNRVTLAAAYLEAGMREQSIQILEQAIQLDPSFKEQGEYYINQIKAGKNP